MCWLFFGNCVGKQSSLQIITFYISAFFEHEWDFLASDGSEICKSGDTVLMRRLEDAAETSESAFLQYLAERQFWKEDDKKKPRAVTFEVSSYLDKLSSLLELPVRIGDGMLCTISIILMVC